MAIKTGDDGTGFSEINMTPFIDVMLVLLTILIITVPIQTHSITIDNPSGQASSERVEVIDLLIDFDGALFWNKRQVNRTTLQHYISHEADKPVQPEVHITVDKFSKYEVVAQTLADLQIRGLKKIGFVNSDYY
jgi:biopolymer transport protein ExbD